MPIYDDCITPSGGAVVVPPDGGGSLVPTSGALRANAFAFATNNQSDFTISQTHKWVDVPADFKSKENASNFRELSEFGSVIDSGKGFELASDLSSIVSYVRFGTLMHFDSAVSATTVVRMIAHAPNAGDALTHGDSENFGAFSVLLGQATVSTQLGRRSVSLGGGDLWAKMDTVHGALDRSGWVFRLQVYTDTSTEKLMFDSAIELTFYENSGVSEAGGGGGGDSLDKMRPSPLDITGIFKPLDLYNAIAPFGDFSNLSNKWDKNVYKASGRYEDTAIGNPLDPKARGTVEWIEFWWDDRIIIQMKSDQPKYSGLVALSPDGSVTAFDIDVEKIFFQFVA